MVNADSTAHTLDVPGARLYYEVSGHGPLLLLLGSPMGSRGFAAIAPLLAEDFTVITYDPRGILHSTIEDPVQEAAPGVLADDVHRLVSALDAGPAYVFGNSGGAATGLALAERHPGQVRALVAHEPPLTELLPEGAELRAAIDDVCATYHEADRGTALKKYTALTGIRFGPPPGGGQEPPGPDAFTPPADVRAILDRFFGYILRPTTRYHPDLAALRAASTRIVVGGGTTSKGQLFHRTAAALANRLGTGLVDFPADHTGFQTRPEPFARLLHKVLTEAA